jgi:hypothetical protein
VLYGTSDQTYGLEGSETPPNSVESALRFASSGQSASGARGKGVRTAQLNLLIEWCSIHGKSLPPDFLIWYSRVGVGGEHTVYRNTETKLAIKVTHPNGFGHSVWADGAVATPLEYLQRLQLHNELFGDAIQICGLILGENHVQIVTTQSQNCRRTLLTALPRHPVPKRV